MKKEIFLVFLFTLALCVYAHIAVDRHITPDGRIVLTPSDDDREIQCVNDYLCIGNVNSACNTDHLHSEGVTHIISLIGVVDCAQNDIPRTAIDVWDVHYQDMTDAFSKANEVIRRVRAEHGRVLVHCAAGVSRSSSTIIYHLMTDNSMTYDDALAVVKSARSIVQPNHGFERQLRQLENKKSEL